MAGVRVENQNQFMACPDLSTFRPFDFSSFRPFVFLSFCLFVFLSFCLFVFSSFCLFVFLSLHPDAYQLYPFLRNLQNLNAEFTDGYFFSLPGDAFFFVDDEAAEGFVFF